ncbi:leucine-rich repeat-containing protein 56 isoform X5 [Herpailurus yagouaroundi]|uniref:leucine-rich repeat-containing protein 56 isoform X5 n=1 Tax=Herpailurus yagouaroundi TaxID=1608482 RepID=UPI001AD7A131|nr:leucine-rich repeat-containing protein 56 isoform X5 [Puma yagouaroundi]
MDQAWDKAHRPWPSTADILVRELSWQGPHNPCPKSKDPGSHGEQLVEEYLSPARLRALAQVDDLRLVGMLEMCVSTRESSLGNFGVHLPNLSQLKLNGSCLGSVRDLGTSLGRLRVLWLARCGLTDLDGIGCFPALKELYVSYNNISDLSPLCLLEQLEVLDLEGNSVEVLEQPPRGGGAQLGHSSGLRGAPQARGHHWTLAVSLEGAPRLQLSGRDHPHGAPIRTLGSQLSLPETQPRAPRPRPLSLLVTGGPLPGGLLPKDPAPQDDTSNLTHGASRVLCGNPTKGLRERRRQCQAWTPSEQLAPQEDLAASASTPGPDPADSSELLALARLQARRELRLRRYLESQQEGATAPWGPRGAPEEQEDESKPRTPSGPQCLVPESSRTSGCNLIPSPPKFPLPSDSSNTFWGSTDLQFRGRRLRALGSLRPGLGQGLAVVTALRGLEVASGPNPRAQGCPSPKPAPDPAARPPRPPVRAAPEPYHPSPIPPLV